MNEDLTVYELDTDDIMRTVETELPERGYDVREQVPAGVWWFATDKDPETVAAEIGDLFRTLIVDRLRRIER